MLRAPQQVWCRQSTFSDVRKRYSQSPKKAKFFFDAFSPAARESRSSKYSLADITHISALVSRVAILPILQLGDQPMEKDLGRCLHYGKMLIERQVPSPVASHQDKHRGILRFSFSPFLRVPSSICSVDADPGSPSLPTIFPRPCRWPVDGGLFGQPGDRAARIER